MSKCRKILLLLGSHQFFLLPLSFFFISLFASRAWFCFHIWDSIPHFIYLMDPSIWIFYHQLNFRVSKNNLKVLFPKSFISLDFKKISINNTIILFVTQIWHLPSPVASFSKMTMAFIPFFQLSLLQLPFIHLSSHF